MKVVVGMSGGVDSSVAAYLLKREGFDVLGVYFSLFRSEEAEKSRCCNLDSAICVGRAIGIPVETVDVSQAFEMNVLQYFTDSYKNGLTPNPCTICNERIKFGLGYEKAQSIFGQSLFATGHYAIVDKDEPIHLRKGFDSTKDQSYMLWRLTPEKLSTVTFPLGKLEKQEVYKIAGSLNLPPVKESEDICFIHGKLFNFLRNYIPEKRGNVINTRGKVLGEHKGAYFYTIGQRSGLGISSEDPLYVVEIDVINNVVIVGEREQCYFRYAEITDVNFIERWDHSPISLSGKVRYRSEENSCILRDERGKVIVEFFKPQFAITPGQSLVLYKDDLVFGGGIINKAIS
jgi:tRNA-specific 2-thiouridylase